MKALRAVTALLLFGLSLAASAQVPSPRFDELERRLQIRPEQKEQYEMAVGATTDMPLSDLWWAGTAQNGWGLALLQQYTTLFGLWFTYDENGNATWFVMPGGNWEVKNEYRGPIYRAAGPAWLGAQYDASRHHVTEAGNFGLSFAPSWDGVQNATFAYTVDGHTATIPLTRIPF